VARVIIGTAGHVDHGKTALIKALTGIDTDRLEEEKRRGLSIDLGFAYLDLPRSGRVGIIDVPGHKDFLKNMLAGVSTIDIGLLVVAADEGVMPQTREHLQILSFFEVKKGLAVISKRDLVEEDLLSLVSLEVRDLLKGTPLEGCPILSVSSVTGEGLEELKSLLDSLAQEVSLKPLDLPFRLPIDRVFILQGIGTVVTGTLISGGIREGEEVEIFPQGINSRIRQIEVHGERRKEAYAGERVALNLAGVKKENLERGDVISRKGNLRPTSLLDARLRTLPEVKKIKNWTRIRLALGTKELIGRLSLLDKNELGGGEEALVQFRLEGLTTALKGDRYVLRNYAPIHLLGGGTILDPAPTKHKRFAAETIRLLLAKEGGDPKDEIEQELKKGPLTYEELMNITKLERGELERLIFGLSKANRIEVLSSYLLHRETFRELEKKILSLVSSFHHQFPLRKGIAKEELRSKLSLEGLLFDQVLTKIQKIKVEQNRVSLRDFTVQYTPKQKEAKDRIERTLLTAQINVPSVDELLSSSGLPLKEAEEILTSLIEAGEVIKIGEGLVFHQKVWEGVKAGVEMYIREKGPLTVAIFRDLFSTSRKYAVPILEYLDRIHYTVRRGDERVLASKGS